MDTPPSKQAKIKCSDCHKLSAAPVVGHFKCIKHRACSGQQYWEPEVCDACSLFKFNLKGYQNEKRDESLDELYNILQETSNEFSNDEVTWGFTDIFSSFFDLQPSQADPIEDGELIDNPETQGDETNEGGVTVPDATIQNQSQPRDQPTTNDILCRMIDRLDDISGALQPIISHIHSRDANTDDRPRKRRRSPSPRRSDSDDSYESDYQSDSHHSRHHNRSPANDSRTRTSRKRGNEFFEQDSSIYFYADNYRRAGSRVWFNGQLRDAKWHPTVDAFTLLNSSTSETPYMSSIKAHESLVSHFRATQDPTDKPGFDRKAYRVPFDDSTGFAHALRLIQQETPDALHYLYTNDLSNFWKLFSNSGFKPSTMVNFSSGWALTDRKYLEWAKKDKLNTWKFSREVVLSYTPFVPTKFLDEECRTRARVTDAITGLSMLDSLAKEVKSNVTIHTSVEAIARHYLSVLSEATLRWYITKMNVRKIVLQGSQAPQAVELIESNMWEPDIFGKDVVKRVIDSDVPRLGIQKRLGLSVYTNNYYKGNPNQVCPDKLGRQPISTVANSTSNQFFQHPISRPRNNATNQNTRQYDKNKHWPNNFNGKGAQTQTQPKGGNTNQKNKNPTGNKRKFWTNPKQKQDGQSGSSGAPKGNKTPQQ